MSAGKDGQASVEAAAMNANGKDIKGTMRSQAARAVTFTHAGQARVDKGTVFKNAIARRAARRAQEAALPKRAAGMGTIRSGR